MQTRRPIYRRTGAAVLVAAAVVVLFGGPAQAHDELVSTNPAAKSTVAVLPDKIVLTFEEPPAKTGSQVLVKGPGGNVQTGAPRFAGNKVSQAIAPGSPGGAYTVTWRITADDGHAVFGRFGFTATAGNTPASPTSTAAPTTSGATGASTPTTASTTNTASTSKSGASKALWLLVLLLLIVPIWLFLRRGRARMQEMSERDQH